MPIYRSVLIYGESGTGKTVSSLTAPRPITIVDADCRVKRLKGVDLTGVEVIEINEPMSGGMSLMSLAKMATGEGKLALYPQGYLKTCEVIEEIASRPEDKSPRTLVIDPLTRMCEHLRRLILYINKRGGMIIPDWGAYLMNLEELISKLKTLTSRMNVVVIAHVSHEKNEKTGEIRYLPHTQGQMENKIASFFDEVYYTRIKETDIIKAIYAYQYMTRYPSNKYVCRTSRGMNVPQFIPANLSDIDAD